MREIEPKFKSDKKYVVLQFEPTWKSWIAIILSFIAVFINILVLVVVYRYTEGTFQLLSETQKHTQLLRKANRAYVYLRPHCGDEEFDNVPLGWPLKLDIINLGSQPAYHVRVTWQSDTRSHLSHPSTNPKVVGVVFPGQPLTVSDKSYFIRVGPLNSHRAKGLKDFLHVKVEYRDIDGLNHYYVGLFLMERLFSSEPTFLPILADADTT